jgi:hypothetical protein
MGQQRAQRCGSRLFVLAKTGTRSVVENQEGVIYEPEKRKLALPSHC